MSGVDAHIIQVMEAAEAAGIGPLTLQQTRSLTAALHTRFPGMTVEDDEPSKPRAHWRRWSEEQDDELRELYEKGIPTGEIAQKLGRSKGAVLGAVSRLKLRRTNGPVGRPRSSDSDD